jgi:hypothetical protein
VLPVKPAGTPAVEHDPDRDRPQRSHPCADLGHAGTAPTFVVTNFPRPAERRTDGIVHHRHFRRSDARHRSGVAASETNIRPDA